MFFAYLDPRRVAESAQIALKIGPVTNVVAVVSTEKGWDQLREHILYATR